MGTILGEIILDSTNKGVVAASDGGQSGLDISVKLGTTEANGVVAASSKLVSIRTGIGGTEVEKAYVDSSGNLSLTGAISATNIPGSVGTVTSVSVTTADGVSGTVATSSTTPAITIALGNIKPTSVDTTAIKNSSTVTVYSTAMGDSNAEVGVTLGTNISTASSAAEALLASFETGIAGAGGHRFAQVSTKGRIDQYGKDGSATVGDVTINAPTGIATLGNGTSSMIVTNSLVQATSLVFVTWLKEPPGLWWIEPTSGSFRMNTSASAGGNIQFCFEVKNMLTGPG